MKFAYKSTRTPKSKEKKKENVPPRQPPSPIYELKLLEYIKDKKLPVEILLINGTKFVGKIKWFSKWMLSLEIEGSEKELMFNKRTIVYYKQSEGVSLAEDEVCTLSEPDVSSIETNVLQEFKDKKSPLIFYMRNNVEIRGTLQWTEKLIYHVRSLDGKKDNNLYKGSILYFKEMSDE